MVEERGAGPRSQSLQEQRKCRNDAKWQAPSVLWQEPAALSVEPGFLVWTCACPRSTHASSQLAEATVLSDLSMQCTTGLPLCNRDASRPPGTIDIRCTMRLNRPLQMATCSQVQRVAEEKNSQAADCPARTAGVLTLDDGRRVCTHLHRIRCSLLGCSCMTMILCIGHPSRYATPTCR